MFKPTSSRGNREPLYKSVVSLMHSAAAYDAAKGLDGDVLVKLMQFLVTVLNPADLAEVEALLAPAIDPNGGLSEAKQVENDNMYARPQRNLAGDQRPARLPLSDGFYARFPNARRIGQV